MLEQSAIIAFIVFAIWFSMQEGEIFGFVQKYSHWKIAPALFDCPVCMCPWWGSVIYVLIWGVNWQWPVVVLTAMGINAVVNKLSPKECEEEKIDQMENETPFYDPRIYGPK